MAGTTCCSTNTWVMVTGMFLITVAGSLITYGLHGIFIKSSTPVASHSEYYQINVIDPSFIRALIKPVLRQRYKKTESAASGSIKLGKKQTKDCYTSRLGTEYIGHANSTRGGFACQAWASQTPHIIALKQVWQYQQTLPERSLKLAKNYCRNPDSYSEGLWCYTVNPEVRWDLCDVPKC